MKSIDFLPDIYRQARADRSNRRWWCTIAGVFAIAILSAAVSQWMLRRRIETELAEVGPKYADALQREAELALVRQEIVRADEVAELYTYLSHPWPRTQLLASIVRPLPQSVRLTEITFGHESLTAGPPLTPASSPPSGGKPSLSPAQADLLQLRSECDWRQPILSITGTASVLTELHAYVDQLGKSPLIAAAHLKGVEASADGQTAGQCRFQLHVVVRPGYGQPDGPRLESETPPPEHLSAVDSAAGIAQKGTAP
jgi:Tfp pilus assembly protein PilN